MIRQRHLYSLMLIIAVAVPTFNSIEGIKADSTNLTSPEFTVKYIDHSYSVPANYSTAIDQYTGQQIQTGHTSYFVQDKRIEITIKKQTFDAIDTEKHSLGLYYNTSCKGHFGDNWTTYNTYPESLWQNDVAEYIQATPNEDLIIVFQLSGNNASTSPDYHDLFFYGTKSGQLDFRVQAYTAYGTLVENEQIAVPNWKPYRIIHNIVNVSEWSEVQTVTVSDSSESNTTVFFGDELAVLTVVCTVIAVLAVCMVVLKRRQHGK